MTLLMETQGFRWVLYGQLFLDSKYVLTNILYTRRRPYNIENIIFFFILDHLFGKYNFNLILDSRHYY